MESTAVRAVLIPVAGVRLQMGRRSTLVRNTGTTLRTACRGKSLRPLAALARLPLRPLPRHLSEGTRELPLARTAKTLLPLPSHQSVGFAPWEQLSGPFEPRSDLRFCFHAMTGARCPFLL